MFAIEFGNMFSGKKLAYRKVDVVMIDLLARRRLERVSLIDGGHWDEREKRFLIDGGELDPGIRR